MNYQALARKWRPTTFDEVIGQPHVVDALSHALNEQRLHHAYLFTGTRGVGKTSLARLFAKSLSCEQGVSANPCNQCSSCEEISQGRFIDLIEVDAASRTKVEDTRELLDNVQYAPTRGRYKIYLIDEVHMLSGHSFNALLKTLEEPPGHVIFLLATTDPQKLPITVLSRCLQFHLKNMSEPAICTQLETILQKEQVEFEPDALSYIATAANGSMRDALSLLDQAIAHGQGKVQSEKVLSMLGCIDKQYTLQLLTALNQNDGERLISVCQQIAELAADYQQVVTDLLHTLTEIALLQTVPSAAITDESQRENLSQLAQSITKENVQLYYQIALIGNKDLSYAPSLQTGFTMLMLRMLSFTPVTNSQPVNTTKPVLNKTAMNTEPTAKAVPEAPVPKPAQAAAPSKIEPPAPKPVERPEAVAIQPESLNWDDVIAELNLQGPLKILANHCMAKKITDAEVHLILDTIQAPLLTERNKERLKDSLTDYFKRKILLTIEISSNTVESPAHKQKVADNLKTEKARASIEKDHNVQAILKEFNATITPDSIKTKD